MEIQFESGSKQAVAVLYQSQIITETTRVPVPLLSHAALRQQRDAATTDRVVLLCTFCQRVAWPLDADYRKRRWIKAADYYRRGGPDEVTVESVVCPHCDRQIVVPNI